MNKYDLMRAADKFQCPNCGEHVETLLINAEGHVFCGYCAERKPNTFEYNYCPICGNYDVDHFYYDGEEIIGCDSCIEFQSVVDYLIDRLYQEEE